MRALLFVAGLLLLALLVWFGAGLFSSEESARSASLASGASGEARSLDPLVAEAREVRRDTTASDPVLENPGSDAAAPRTSEREEPNQEPQRADELRLRVIDGATREPLEGIELEVYWLVERGSAGSSVGLAMEKTAGPEREVRIARASVDQRRRQQGDEGVVLVRARGLFAEPIERRVKTEPWPTEVQDLVLPPSGWIEVEVQDELGRTLELDGRVMLRPTGEHGWSGSRSLELQRGVTPMSLCGVDVALEATGELSDGSKLGPSQMRGPLVPGETRREALRRLQLGSKLAIRVLLPSGEPLRSKMVEVAAKVERKTGGSSMSTMSGSHEKTDAEGWLRLVVPEPKGGEGLRRAYELGYQEAEQEQLAAFLEVNEAFAPGETTLGDVRLQAESLVASGVVMQREGQPLQGVQVSARLLGAAGEELGMSGGAMVETDAEGRFLLRTRRPAARARLQARREGYVEVTPREVVCGERGLVLELEAAASLRGTVVLPRGMDPRSISVHIEGLAAHRDGLPRGTVDADGGFLLQGIAPQIGAVVFSLPGSGELARIQELRFLSGEENRDPRVQGLELCGDWRELVLRLLRPEGTVFDGRSFELATATPRSRRTMRTDAEGLAKAWFPSETARFELRTAGYRSLAFEWAPQTLELQLRAGIRVVLPVEAPKVEPIARLQMELASPGGARSARVDVLDGLAELVVPEPGIYEVMPGFVIVQGSGMIGSSFRLDPPMRVEVGEDDQQRLPVCRISEAALHAALKAR